MRESTKKILELYEQGLGVNAIARQIGCTPANVSKLVSNYADFHYKLDPLPVEHVRWLVAKAKKHRLSASKLATKLLQDSIDVYMSKEIEDDASRT
jgi:predicted transcriptional regulator